MWKTMVMGWILVSYKIVEYGKKCKRRNYSRIRNTYKLKDLLEIQKKCISSYLPSLFCIASGKRWCGSESSTGYAGTRVYFDNWDLYSFGWSLSERYN